MTERAKFRSFNNDVVLAELVDAEEGKWEIVTYEKKPVQVRRTHKEGAKKLGKCLKEIREVVKSLTNKEFKRKYFPANYAAVDMYDMTEYPEPERKTVTKPVPKLVHPKPTTKLTK